MTTPAKKGYGYIRDLRGRHVGDRAIILGKGPSLDVWWSRGGCGADRDGLVVMAINETVLLPGLNADYWFWPHPEHPEQVNKYGGAPASTVQIFDEYVLRKYSEFCEGQIKLHQSLVHMRGVDAPDDPYAPPRNATTGSTAFFCAGLWGMREVLAVGFDGKDKPQDKRYAHCLLPFTIDRKHVNMSYRQNNRDLDTSIGRFDLEVTWYHRELTNEEIDDAGRSFDSPS